MNLEFLGIVYNISGAFILLLVSIFGVHHQRIHHKEKWSKRYYWLGWRPIYKNTQTLKWVINLKGKIVKYGLIPPKYQWSIVGFLLIFLGFIAQLIGSL